MKQFAEINPQTIAQDPRVVASIQDNHELTVIYYFLIDQDYFILANTFIHYLPR